MQLSQIKNQIHSLVEQNNDEQLLYVIRDQLTQQAKHDSRLVESYDQFLQGKTTPHNEVMKLAETWATK